MAPANTRNQKTLLLTTRGYRSLYLFIHTSLAAEIWRLGSKWQTADSQWQMARPLEMNFEYDESESDRGRPS